MDYRGFTAEDLINDAFFNQWVLNPTSVNNTFWSDFLNSNPDKIADIEEAREFIVLLSADRDDDVSAFEIQRIKHNIDQALWEKDFAALEFEPVSDVTGTAPATLRNAIHYYKIAASVMLMLLAGLSLYYFKIKSAKSNNHMRSAKLEAPKENDLLLRYQTGQKSGLMPRVTCSTPKPLNIYQHAKYTWMGSFFDVAEDKSKPFIVHTSDVSIKVLGTAFNVRSFAQDPVIETTLVRGRITINRKATPHEQLALLPLEQAVFKKKSQELILYRHIETDNYTAWRHGELVFNEKPLPDIIKDLERWYNVRIHMDNLTEQKCSFSGRFKNERLEEVLELLKARMTSALK